MPRVVLELRRDERLGGDQRPTACRFHRPRRRADDRARHGAPARHLRYGLRTGRQRGFRNPLRSSRVGVPDDRFGADEPGERTGAAPRRRPCPVDPCRWVLAVDDGTAAERAGDSSDDAGSVSAFDDRPACHHTHLTAGGAGPCTTPQERVTNDGMTISSVSPKSGPVGGETSVTVTGRNLPENMRSSSVLGPQPPSRVVADHCRAGSLERSCPPHTGGERLAGAGPIWSGSHPARCPPLRPRGPRSPAS